MRLRESIGYLRAAVQRAPDRHQSPRDHPAQRLTVHVLHDDVGTPVPAADLMDRDDVGMVQRGGGSRFLREAREAIGVGRELLRQELDRHVAM